MLSRHLRGKSLLAHFVHNMKIHRFYVSSVPDLSEIVLHDPLLIHQWSHVLRFRSGQRLALFDGTTTDGLYELIDLHKDAAKLRKIAANTRQVPAREVYLFWSVLKKDKNDWVLQKCTELGVSYFVPLVTDRSEKANINMTRAQKIITEASEQSGRSDIPTIIEPISLKDAVDDYHNRVKLFICEQGEDGTGGPLGQEAVGILVGPEGGWSEVEKAYMKSAALPQMNLGAFTLRAETACIIGAAKLQ